MVSSSNEEKPFNTILLESRKEFLKTYYRRMSIALISLLIIAILYSLYIARPILLPITIALLLNFLLSPLMRILKKFWIPNSLSAALIILFSFSLLGVGFYKLAVPFSVLVTNAPQDISQAILKLEKLAEPVNNSINKLFKIGSQIEKTTNPTQEKNVQVVTIKQHDVFNSLFNNTTEFIAQLALIALFLYFLLASEDFFLHKAVEVIPHLKEKKEVVTIVYEIEKQISYFLVMKIVISSILIGTMTIAMLLCQMPNAILWGVFAGVLYFVPYLGALIGTIFIAIYALLTFDYFAHIILIPLIYFTLSSFMGNVVEPIILSRGLILHPVIIFISIIFMGWIWGIAGALIAIPLLSILKIICDNVAELNAFGRLLGK